jgi:hypothetical protein
VNVLILYNDKEVIRYTFNAAVAAVIVIMELFGGFVWRLFVV